MLRHSPSTALDISSCLELAMLLEVSAYPKPGNVHRTRDYPETKYEHFLASAVSARPYFEEAAERGIQVSKRQISFRKVRVGEIIHDASVAMMRSQRGGNTSLGTLTLLVPLAVAAGVAITGHAFSVSCLRRKVNTVVRSTTEADAVDFYEAVACAKPGGLGNVALLDVKDAASRIQILRRRLTLFNVFQVASAWDSVCSEWVSNYRMTFELGFPYFKKELSRSGDLNQATVNTYLKLLENTPDTLIARKAGIQTARRVSMRAKKALMRGGLRTSAGTREIGRLDRILRTNGHILNPGATADLCAAVIALVTLSGYLP